ncbi:MAG TPA: arylesterase [Dongiaceae bacterium]|nr:arylesterase [Dongiaceae bacterium]
MPASTPLSRVFRLAQIVLLGVMVQVASVEAAPVKILALGDSLTAGFGLPPGQGFVPQLQKALKDSGIDAEVQDGGVSGDTTAGGLARLDWALAENPKVVIVELGANDALRGLDPAQARSNLSAILAKLAAQHRGVLLAGMLAPPNLGTDYGAAFNAIYPDLARQYGVVLYPFFLDGVAANPALNQPDGLHPTAEGVAIIVKRLLPSLRQVIAKAEGSS